ncbi:hypothetical protein CEE37_14385 [candidate division LCP-89 bacterium B3_LCP]|uniref:Tetratricopeptide repeat protein n=1 Tax=candidate division LCP-89 bacterium B3_LCP TaxID=2012998 RepID=A0A532UPN8_UNCL8|nr:MAG: hypothetical protein CEE37_14385 [candidate division LCP-89 bacterium B3_LCP]
MFNFRTVYTSLSFIIASSLLAAIPNPNSPKFQALKDTLEVLDFEESIQLLKTKIKEDPNEPEYYRRVGDLLQLNENYTEAVTYLKKALNLYPEYVQIEELLINCCWTLNDKQGLKKHLKALHEKNGMGDFLEEYNYNMLTTLSPNAILFTNGDNDTYPAWYWQYVRNYRKDVSIVNLSLLNTASYINILKHNEPRLSMSFSDDYIDEYLDKHDLAALKSRYWPKNDPERSTILQIETPDGDSFTWDVPATMHLPTGDGDTGEPNFLRVQDIMLIDIIRTNKWHRPIYFAVTVSNSNMLGLQNHLVMEGLAFRLVPQPKGRIDPESMKANLLEKYRYDTCRNFQDITHQTFDPWYRGVRYPPIESEKRITQNYRSAFLQLATYYLNRDEQGTGHYQVSDPYDLNLGKFDEISDKDKVLFLMDTMEKVIPENQIPLTNDEIVLHIGQLYCDLGRLDELVSRLNRLCIKPDVTAEQLMRYGAVYLKWVSDTLKATSIFQKILEKDASPEMKFEVASAFTEINDTETVLRLLNDLENQTLDTQLLIKIGVLYLNMDCNNKAEGVFESLKLRAPGDGAVIGGLLMTYEKLRKHEAAYKLLEDWIADHPNDDEAIRKKTVLARRIYAGNEGVDVNWKEAPLTGRYAFDRVMYNLIQSYSTGSDEDVIKFLDLSDKALGIAKWDYNTKLWEYTDAEGYFDGTGIWNQKKTCWEYHDRSGNFLGSTEWNSQTEQWEFYDIDRQCILKIGLPVEADENYDLPLHGVGGDDEEVLITEGFPYTDYLILEEDNMIYIENVRPLSEITEIKSESTTISKYGQVAKGAQGYLFMAGKGSEIPVLLSMPLAGLSENLYISIIELDGSCPFMPRCSLAADDESTNDIIDAVNATWIFTKPGITFKVGNRRFRSKYSGATIRFTKEGVYLKGFDISPKP